MEKVLSYLKLKPGEVDLWFVFSDQINDPELLDAYRGLLNSYESEQQKKYVFDRHRKQDLITRALIRTTLSKYAEIAPESWEFRFNSYGKPSIKIPEDQEEIKIKIPPLTFNLSHCKGMILCGVSLDIPVGVDVEFIERRTEVANIAGRFFSPSEVRSLRALPVEHQRDRFFDFWTLKESYIKGRGVGLSLSLEAFSFDLSNPDTINFAIDSVLKDLPENWWFALMRPTKTVRAAMALGYSKDKKAPVSLRIRQTIPLGESGPMDDIVVSHSNRVPLLFR